MKGTSPWLVRLAYLYLVLPNFIFIITWCNLPTAWMGGLILLASLYFALKNAPALWIPQNSSQKILLGVLALAAFVWVCFSGIGGLVFQNIDHHSRNFIFNWLYSSAWPATATVGTVDSSPYITTSSPYVLTYYIAFWLPAAVVAKLFASLQVGYYIQIVWATLGVWLFFYLLLTALKRKTYWPVFVFIFFSGLDVVGYILMEGFAFSITTHLEWWSRTAQFSSFTTQLFWVFNQAIPTWLTVLLMYNEKNNKNLVFLYANLFLWATLPALGLFPFVAYWCLKNGSASNNLELSWLQIKNSIKTALSFQNLAGALCLMLICMTYLSSSVLKSAVQPSIPPSSLRFLVFLLLEVFLFLGCLWPVNRRNTLYYLCAVCFLIYPWIRIGLGHDFCMRATLAPLVLLCLFVIQTLENATFRSKYRTLFFMLIILLGFGAVTPLHEFARTIYYTYKRVPIQLPVWIIYENYLGKVSPDNNFLHYFGKKPLPPAP